MREASGSIPIGGSILFSHNKMFKREYLALFSLFFIPCSLCPTCSIQLYSRFFLIKKKKKTISKLSK